MSVRRIEAPSELNQDTGRDLLSAALQQPLNAGDELVIDLQQTSRMDSRGGAWLIHIADELRRKKAAFRLEGQAGEVADFVEMIAPGLETPPPTRRVGLGFVERVGDRCFRVWSEARDFANLTADAVYWTLIGPLEGRRFRWGLFIDEIHEMGVRGVQINLLMNFLLGLIIAMLSAAQLDRYGVGIYVADLIVIAFARELAALMTAVVVSARTGAAIAAELATMQVQEEIDALRGMGLNVPQFLVAPKVLALLVVMPCLTVMGMIAGVAGGSLWGTFMLGFRLDMWLHETHAATDYSDIFQGLLKALVFAVMIVLVGCHNGLRVRGGSRGVGLMTTRAVVMDIFFIVVIDMIFAVIFYYVLD